MSQPNRARVALVAGVCAAALTLCGAAQAQKAAAAGAAGAADTSGATAVEEIVVTAQRKQEAAQTVPIAITAFSPQQLEARKIEGGPDLLKGVPNATFTKTNFSGYNLTIRGIGTQAISVATDPGVSVNFNSTALIRNRLFEQEFFDVERVEVLRGPQGTLYGRNATAGAVNVISAKPSGIFEGEIKGELGNFDTRRVSGFVNVPIIGDKLDLRVAGAYTKRGGFEFNSTTGDFIDGRDLYSTRVTVGFKPNERLHGNFVWEHFDENDDRQRSGKQLCTRDPGLSSIGSVQNLSIVAQAFTSQGCLDASLYAPEAFGTPNGFSIPFVLAAVSNAQILGVDPITRQPVNLLKVMDPYGGQMQSTDLREIASIFNPQYKAQADIFELNFDYELTPNLTFSSQTAYNHDNYYSTEDYNRFNTVPGVFNDSTGVVRVPASAHSLRQAPDITPGGVYCDPQLGCSDTIAGLDLSRANSHQFSQEFRLTSSFDGKFNFSVGANYTEYDTIEDYFVFFNIISAIAQSHGPAGNYSRKLNFCNDGAGPRRPVTPDGTSGCIYIDPNPLADINGLGHNYFRSENPYELRSGAVFGEVYYKLTPTVKLTGGLRVTDDNKEFTEVPSQVLLSSAKGGTVDGGYPTRGVVKQHWTALTGRMGVDWTPDLSFTDKTLIYAFYNRGYKAGGANPPGIGYGGTSFLGGPPAQLFNYPPTFRPEYINAFEIGAKNALFGGSLILNGDVFYYDYKDYQVSQIEDRSAINENFNAKIWGAELTGVWQATHRLRFNVDLGYQDSRIADGAQSIDVMNRTQGNPDFIVFKASEYQPSNCVIAKSFVENFIAQNRANGFPDEQGLIQLCPGSFISVPIPPEALPNGGRGFFADLSGHNLPNAPHFTQTIGVQYDIPLLDGWEATLRGDVYHQTASWARVYQDPIDRLKGWSSVNLRLTVAKPAYGLEFEVYVKNLLDDTPLTGAFVNSDDTALTTNVFTLDPRLIGGSIRKRF